MNPSIKDYIEKTYTPELQTVFENVIAMLDKLNVNSYEAYFVNELNDLDNKDPEFVSSNFYYYFTGFLTNLSKEFGFTLIEDATLEQQYEFINGYVDLEYYIDHEAVIRTMEMDASAEEKLSEAVSLTSNLTADTLITLIESVDDAALITLQRLHILETNKEELVDETETSSVKNAQITQIKAFKLFLGEREATIKIFELVRAGYDIGMPFRVYWSNIGTHLTSNVDELDAQEMVRELMAVILVSKEMWINPLINFKSLVEYNWEDINIISALTTAYRKLISDFDLFKANNRIK